MHRSGREGVLFGAGMSLFSAEWPTGPKRPGSTAPTYKGRSGPLEGFKPISGRVPAPSSPSVTSQIPGITTSSRSPLFWPGEQARSREEPLRTKWAREGKEVGAAAPPFKKFRETPRTPPPSHSRLITHPTSSRSTATPRAGSSPHSPLDVPLNKTIESKTTLVLEPPISPFATWIPIFQECEAAKPEPAILSR